MSKFPRLSETMIGPRAPQECANCGDINPDELWQECDDNDQPEKIYFRLCKPCAKRIIKPHPRLYQSVDPNQPLPGLSDICDNCIHREGYNCNQTLASNGPGLKMFIAAPFVAHFYRSGGRSGWERIYTEQAHACTRRQADMSHKDYGP